MAISAGAEGHLVGVEVVFPPVLAYKKRLFYGGCTRKMYGKRGGARSPPLVHCNSSYVRQTYRWIRRLVWRTFCVYGRRTDEKKTFL